MQQQAQSVAGLRVEPSGSLGSLQGGVDPPSTSGLHLFLPLLSAFLVLFPFLILLQIQQQRTLRGTHTHSQPSQSMSADTLRGEIAAARERRKMACSLIHSIAPVALPGRTQHRGWR